MAGILKKVAEAAREDVTGLELDRLAEGLVLKSGGEPAFKGYKTENEPPFPATICFSVNEGVVHGIPTDRKLKLGDLVKLDIGMKWPGKGSARGFFTDTATTVSVGEISEPAKKLMDSTKTAMDLGIKAVKAGVRVGDVSYAIQNYLDGQKIGIIKELAGHGVGYEVHEDPLVPNYGKPGKGIELLENMVLAIEVMTTLGSGKVKLAKDQWTYESADGSLGAHFEHTVVVTGKGAEILTR